VRGREGLEGHDAAGVPELAQLGGVAAACRSHVEHEVDAAVDEQTLPPGRGVAAHDESPARQLAHHHVADP
jgi:hypothetical protein